MDETTAPLGDQRHLFDLKDGVVFLNAASKSALLKASVEAGKTGAAAKGRPWAIDEPARYVQADDIRDRFATRALRARHIFGKSRTGEARFLDRIPERGRTLFHSGKAPFRLANGGR